MDINTQILDAVLRKYAKSDKELYTSLENVSEDEFKEKLEVFNLSDYTKRDSFYWELQLMVEKYVAEHGGSEDNEQLAEMVVKEWNRTSELEINQTLALSFIYLINLKFPNSRKAFISVCDGDLQSYKTFNSKSRLFNDMLVRFFICFYGKQQYNLISRSVEQVMSSLFEGTTKSDYRESITRLGFQGRKGPIYGKMNAYRRAVGANGLVYVEGMKAILLSALEEAEETEVLSILKQRLIEDVNGSEMDDFGVDDLLASNSFVPKKEELSSDNTVVGGEKATVKTESLSSVVKEEEIESVIGEPIDVGSIGEVDNKETAPVQKEDPKHEVVTSLEEALSTIQDAIVKVSKLSNTQSHASKKSNHGQLKLAEEEIDRLKLALHQEKEKVELAEEKAYAKLLNAIGGESSNYLLSDLYEESQGKAPNNPKISAGRLINLFTSLGLTIGLEEHSNNYEIGNIFSIDKDELIKNYRIDGPIASQSDVIQVRLLKYGWIINGKVVVQPLVTEVKEEV